ncbi:MAG: CHAT domain-containing protein [Anaerolineae bacterium]|nr:CHAT domain-containing protein [Anaerolineae bacterium]
MPTNDGYCDYEIRLAWDSTDGVIVNDVPTGKYTGTTLDQLNSHDPFSIIKQNVGDAVTKLLFPQSQDVETFKNMWGDCQRIRIRLVYPADIDQQAELLKIPWEYIYLPLNEQNPADRGNWLALNDDVSIVHSLPNVQGPIASMAQARKIKVDYVSWLGNDKEEERGIFKRFETAIQSLKEVTDLSVYGSNIGITPDGSLPEPADKVSLVEKALQNTNLLHITSHGASGSEGKLELEDGDVLTPDEVFNADFSAQIKAILVLSCQSGGGTSSFALQFHLRGVPVVIGMTHVIQFDPAEDFVAGFYNALSRNLTLGLEFAIVAGRRCMYEKVRGNWYAGFGLPRLFLNGSDSSVIRKDNLYPDDQIIKSFTAFRNNLIGDDPYNILHQIDISQDNLNALKNWITNRIPQRLWYLMIGEADDFRAKHIAKILKELEGQGHKLVYHFCLDKPLETDNPNMFIDTKDRLAFVRDSLFPQLVPYFGEEKYFEWCPLDQFPLLTHNAQDALMNFIYTPLAAAKLADPEYEKSMPIIIIDGIDLIPPGHSRNNSILGLLLKYQDILGNVARFLITANTLDIDDDDPEAKALIQDIRDLTLHYGNELPDLIIAPPITSDGLLNRGVEENFELSKPLEIPPGKSQQQLNQYFQAAIERAKLNYEHLNGDPILVNRLLDAIALAYEPLSADDMASVIGLPANSDEMMNLLRVVEPFCKPYDTTQEHRLVLFHSKLKKYILNNMDVAFTHELFIKAFSLIKDTAKSAKWSKVNDWSKLSQTNWANLSAPSTKYTVKSSEVLLPRYVRRYLVHHAYESYSATAWRNSEARIRRADSYLNLICDPGYRTVRLAEVGLEESIQDLWNGLRVIYTEHIHKAEATIEHTEQARLALDRMLAANQPDSYLHRELLELEETFRRCDVDENVSRLRNFLLYQK